MQTQYTDAVLQYIGPSENATVLRMLTSATVSRYRVPNLCTLFYIYIYIVLRGQSLMTTVERYRYAKLTKDPRIWTYFGGRLVAFSRRPEYNNSLNSNFDFFSRRNDFVLIICKTNSDSRCMGPQRHWHFKRKLRKNKCLKNRVDRAPTTATEPRKRNVVNVCKTVKKDRLKVIFEFKHSLKI